MTLTNFFVGIPAMLLCLIVQLAAAFLGIRHSLLRLPHRRPAPRGFPLVGHTLFVAMLILMVGNLFQIAIWGALFVCLGEFDEMYEAIYHSAVNFTSLGYGDVVMSKPWKLLGPLEAVNGVLMLGMSGATLLAILQQIIKSLRDDR